VDLELRCDQSSSLAKLRLLAGWRHGPITGPRADSKISAVDSDFETMIAARGIVWREAEQVLRVQFGAELLDRFLKAFEPRERECGPTGALRQRLDGVGFPEPDEFSHATQDVNALFRRG